MKKIKIIVDGFEPSKEEVLATRDFNKVLRKYNRMKPAIFVNPWFYGIVGLSSLMIAIIFVK